MTMNPTKNLRIRKNRCQVEKSKSVIFICVLPYLNFFVMLPIFFNFAVKGSNNPVF